MKVGVRFSGSKGPKTRFACHIIPGHGLEGVSTLHNYLASIFTALRPTEPQAIPVSAQVSDVRTSRGPHYVRSPDAGRTQGRAERARGWARGIATGFITFLKKRRKSVAAQ